jgi:hypothetical protein
LAVGLSSFGSTSQSTSWSSSSNRNERVSRSAPNTRCASAEVRVEGNICSYARSGLGRNRAERMCVLELVPKNGFIEPMRGCGACNGTCRSEDRRLQAEAGAVRGRGGGTGRELD